MTDSGLARFSLVAFAVALVTVGVGTAIGLAVVPLAVGTYLGTLVGGFVAGLLVEKRPLLESGSAAVLVGLGVLAAGPFVGDGIGAAIGGVAAVGPLDLLVSTVLSFAVGAFGAHFGDDLREGLTEPVETTDGSTDISSVGVPPLSEEETDEASVDREREASAGGEDHSETEERELELE